MASIVDICNLALSHLGNRASVVSISPVDGSVEADYCARFYQLARDEILELGDWTFARKRAALVELTVSPSTTWERAYALPSDCMVPRRIVTGKFYEYEDDSTNFDVEGATLLCNKASAELIYTRPVEDPTQFSPGFVTAVSYKLSAYLAGPILRGDAGTAAAGQLHKIAAAKTMESMMVDANRSWRSNEYVPSMVAARGGYMPNTASGSNPILYPGPGYVVD